VWESNLFNSCVHPPISSLCPPTDLIPVPILQSQAFEAWQVWESNLFNSSVHPPISFLCAFCNHRHSRPGRCGTPTPCTHFYRKRYTHRVSRNIHTGWVYTQGGCTHRALLQETIYTQGGSHIRRVGIHTWRFYRRQCTHRVGRNIHTGWYIHRVGIHTGWVYTQDGYIHRVGIHTGRSDRKQCTHRVGRIYAGWVYTQGASTGNNVHTGWVYTQGRYAHRGYTCRELLQKTMYTQGGWSQKRCSSFYVTSSKSPCGAMSACSVPIRSRNV